MGRGASAPDPETAREGGTIERSKKEPSGSFFYSRARGFTVPELIAVITIAGVLAAVAVPRLTTTSASFDEVRLYDQTLAGLRYAQKSAVAMQRNVCAIFTATQLTLRYRGAYGAGACNTDLMPPGGGGPGGLYTVTAQGAAGYGASLTITYDRTGKPDAGQTISLNGGRQIVVEAETGYAR